MDLDTQYIAALLAAADGDDATAHKILDGDDGGVNSQNMSEQFHGPPRSGLVPQSGDPEHPKHWIRPEEANAPSTGSKTTPQPVASPPPPAASAKPKAQRGEMTGAQRVGKGKDAKIVLADGSPAPAHITAGMVPPAWTDVKVSADPEADVFVTGKDAKGRPKTVYNPKFSQLGQDVKFARVAEGVQKAEEMHAQNLKNRDNPKLANNADATWLMLEQATRPGSESDTKGMANLYGKPLAADDFELGKPDKAGTPGIVLKINGQSISIKDKKTRAEIAKRIASGGNLEDSTYWLKSHGATTLEGKHVVEAPDGVRLQFVGKEGVWHDHLVKNPDLAAMLTERADKAGPSGSLFDTDYDSVAKYAKGKLDGGKFTPKDFRTMKATSLALEEINRMKAPQTEKEYKIAAMDVAKKVSGVLGNEPPQALESYIAPEVFANWRSNLNG